jgi:hypothetical protein
LPNSTYGQTHGSAEMTFSPDGERFTGRMMDMNWGSELEWGAKKYLNLSFERDTLQIWDVVRPFPEPLDH